LFHVMLLVVCEVGVQSEHEFFGGLLDDAEYAVGVQSVFLSVVSFRFLVFESHPLHRAFYERLLLGLLALRLEFADVALVYIRAGQVVAAEAEGALNLLGHCLPFQVA